jgi:hypothetical protein
MTERFASWLITGPLGHLASALLDWATFLARTAKRQLRRC